MVSPITDSESLAEEPLSFDPPDDDAVWTTVSFSTEGVGITLYRDGGVGGEVIDETWLTRAELVEALAENQSITLR